MKENFQISDTLLSEIKVKLYPKIRKGVIAAGITDIEAFYQEESDTIEDGIMVSSQNDWTNKGNGLSVEANKLNFKKKIIEVLIESIEEVRQEQHHEAAPLCSENSREVLESIMLEDPLLDELSKIMANNKANIIERYFYDPKLYKLVHTVIAKTLIAVIAVATIASLTAAGVVASTVAAPVVALAGATYLAFSIFKPVFDEEKAQTPILDFLDAPMAAAIKPFTWLLDKCAESIEKALPNPKFFQEYSNDHLKALVEKNVGAANIMDTYYSKGAEAVDTNAQISVLGVQVNARKFLEAQKSTEVFTDAARSDLFPVQNATSGNERLFRSIDPAKIPTYLEQYSLNHIIQSIDGTFGPPCTDLEALRRLKSIITKSQEKQNREFPGHA